MAWIEMHQSLLTHRKTRRAARLLGMPCVSLCGHLYALWSWALDNAPEGRIDPDDVAEAAQYGEDAGEFLVALIESGFIERRRNGACVLHDWDQYGGKLCEQRKRDAEKKRRYRAAKSVGAPHRLSPQSSGDVPRDVPDDIPLDIPETSLDREEKTTPEKRRVENSTITPPPPRGGRARGRQVSRFRHSLFAEPKGYAALFDVYPRHEKRLAGAALYTRYSVDEQASMAAARYIPFTASPATFPIACKYTGRHGILFTDKVDDSRGFPALPEDYRQDGGYTMASPRTSMICCALLALLLFPTPGFTQPEMVPPSYNADDRGFNMEPPDTEHVTALLAQLKDPDAAARLDAARKLVLAREPRIVEALLAALDDPDRAVKKAVIDDLRMQHDPRAMPDVRAVEPLLAVLPGNDAMLRQNAIGALAAIKDPRAFLPLLDILLRGDPLSQQAAARALPVFGDQRVVPPLIEVLQTAKNAAVRARQPAIPCRA